MPSLASMRQLDPGGDSFQPLGPPIRETPVDPTPLPKPTGTPGVVQMPDGKLATNLPDPTVKPATKLDLSGTVTGRHSGCEANLSNEPKAVVREPQVGDLVRVLSGQPFIGPINEMVGNVYPVKEVRASSIELAGGWFFHRPGVISNDGRLETEFAESPL